LCFHPYRIARNPFDESSSVVLWRRTPLAKLRDVSLNPKSRRVVSNISISSFLQECPLDDLRADDVDVTNSCSILSIPMYCRLRSDTDEMELTYLHGNMDSLWSSKG
uniref:Neur_chan_LBD domain-containing protein n=1 Tax=Steinernema glaseri TaxID=37863 RepID=A0A1I7YIX2_9BILA